MSRGVGAKPTKPTMTARKRTALRLNAYTLVSDAIDHGVEVGWQRAFKYTDDPSSEVFMENVKRSVMELINEVVSWERSG